MIRAATTAMIAACLLFLAARPVRARHPLHVAFINPANHEYWFWGMVEDFMSAAAEDLGIVLEIHEADWDQERMRELAREICLRRKPPDYLIVVNEKLAAGDMLRMADTAGVPTFMIVNVFRGEESWKYGRPREKFKSWLGELRPDNHMAGFCIAEELHREWQRLHPDQDLQLAALSGDTVTYASVERVQGLEEYLAWRPGMWLLQVVPTYWERERAREALPSLLHRYPAMGAVWTASDGMALGVLDGLKDEGLTPGRDILVGGCGWHPDAVRAVARGEMTTTVGGHFMDGGWALVLLYDHFHGRDFVGDPGSSTMQAITCENAEQLLSLFEGDWGSIDFRRFSKVHHPEQDWYDFSLERLVPRP